MDMVSIQEGEGKCNILRVYCNQAAYPSEFLKGNSDLY